MSHSVNCLGVTNKNSASQELGNLRSAGQMKKRGVGKGASCLEWSLAAEPDLEQGFLVPSTPSLTAGGTFTSINKVRTCCM